MEQTIDVKERLAKIYSKTADETQIEIPVENFDKFDNYHDDPGHSGD